MSNPQPATGAAGANPNLRRHALVAVFGLIAVLPIWIPTFPAMCDAPQHASQVVIYSQLKHPGFAYSQLFVVHMLTPNLAGYIPLLLLKPLVGVVAACKLVVSAALFGFLLATSWLVTEFGGDPLLALLAVPGLYGFPFQWGFIGFLVAAPFGICFLVFAKRYFRHPSVRGGIGLGLFFLFVFFCHAMTAAYAAGLAAVYALADMHSARQLLFRWLPIIVTVPTAGLWWVHSVARNPFTHRPMEWDLDWNRFSNIFLHITGWPGALLAFLFVVALIAPIVFLLGMRRQWRFYVLFACCMANAIFTPRGVFGADAVYERYAVFVLPCFALTLAPINLVTRRRAKMAIGWLAIFALVWIAGVAWRMTVFEREARGFSTLLRQMAPGQRVLSINFERNSKVFEGAVFLHFPVWYSALKFGLVDPSFACGNVDLVLYRREAMPKARFADFEFHPESFNWQEHEGWRYRYFVVHSPAEAGAKLFASSEKPVILRAHEDDWWLYENMAPLRSSIAQPDSPPCNNNRAGYPAHCGVEAIVAFRERLASG